MTAIESSVRRINRRKRNSWRAQVRVDGATMFTGHRDTKPEAEEIAATMEVAYQEAHRICTSDEARAKVSEIRSRRVAVTS